METITPASSAVYPMNIWRNSGMRIIEENITTPARNIIRHEPEKLKILNNFTSTMGCFCRHSHTTRAPRQTAAMITSEQMK